MSRLLFLLFCLCLFSVSVFNKRKISSALFIIAITCVIFGCTPLCNTQFLSAQLFLHIYTQRSSVCVTHTHTHTTAMAYQSNETIRFTTCFLRKWYALCARFVRLFKVCVCSNSYNSWACQYTGPRLNQIAIRDHHIVADHFHPYQFHRFIARACSHVVHFTAL